MKNKIIVSSILTIALCLSMIAGSTFALFTSESKVDIAVTSGTLDVDAVINNDLQLSSLGVAQTGTFANGGTATLAGDTLTLDKLTPGDKATFSITVTNNSNVAMNYRFVWSVEGDLYPFLTATVDGVALVNNSTPYTLWDTSVKTKTFAVVVELPQGVGNDAQNKTADISFKVEAVQGNVEIVDGIEYRTNENGQKVLYDVFGETPSVVTVPEGIEVIGNWSLNDATFEAINLPSTLKTIGSRAFKGNTALKSVTIPAGTETIVEGAFQQSSLESATINGGSIGNQAFGYISTLETVILGENVSYVGNYAFRGCASLKTVIILNENIEFGGTAMAFSNAESGKSDNITIYVPNDEVAAKVRIANGSCTGYTVVVGDPRVNNTDELVAAINARNTEIFLLPGNYDLRFTNNTNFHVDGITIKGLGNNVNLAISSSEAWYGRVQGSNVTFENIHFTSTVGTTGKATYNNCTFDSWTICASSNKAETYYNNCTINGCLNTSTDLSSGDVYVNNCYIAKAEYSGSMTMNFKDCTIGEMIIWNSNTNLTNCKVTTLDTSNVTDATVTVK